jgi:hypothetical protein
MVVNVSKLFNPILVCIREGLHIGGSAIVNAKGVKGDS